MDINQVSDIQSLAFPGQLDFVHLGAPRLVATYNPCLLAADVLSGATKCAHVVPSRVVTRSTGAYGRYIGHILNVLKLKNSMSGFSTRTLLGPPFGACKRFGASWKFQKCHMGLSTNGVYLKRVMNIWGI